MIKSIILFKLGILKLPIKIANVLHVFAFSIKLKRRYNNLLLKSLGNISVLNLSIYDINNISFTILENRKDNSYNNFSSLFSPK